MDPRIRIAKLALDMLEKFRVSSRLKGDLKPLRSKLFELMYIDDLDYLKEETKFFEEFDYSKLKYKDSIEKEVKWAINTLKNLRKKFDRGKGSSILLGLDLGLGTVISTSKMDKLLITRVETKHGTLTIITNMLNIKKGDKVPYVILPPRKFNNVYSEAMFLSEPINDLSELNYKEIEGKVAAIIEELEK